MPSDELWALLGAVSFRADPASLRAAPEGDPASELSWRAMVPKSHHQSLMQMLRDVAADGFSRVMEHPGLVSGRSDVFFRTAVLRVQSAETGKIELAGVMLDVSEARAHERQWRELESWLVALGESLPFDFWICDRYGRVALQNPSSARHWGNLLGQGFEEEAWQRGHAHALEGRVYREELELELEGERRIVERVIAPVEGEGQVQGSLGVDIDVTELKRVEQRLRQSLEELRQAQETLVRREQLVALGEMAGVVAHEVRNPLGAMCNAIHLLRKRENFAGQSAELLRILEEESRRLDELVSNLLELVRPHEAHVVVQPLRPVLQDALSNALRTAGPEKRIQVLQRLASAPTEIPMDARLLELALVNVVRNAVQAIHEEGQLVMDVRSEDAGGANWVRISVQDTGHGIARDVRERIFEPFFTTRSMGSGIGLAIVRRVVSEHHGRVEVHSEQGRGTEFVMLLPGTTGDNDGP
jgi:signal transduction histidine kinase